MHRIAPWIVGAAGLALAGSIWAEPTDGWRDLGGELRGLHSHPSVNPNGPLAQAQALAPDRFAGPVSSTQVETELRGRWRFISADAVFGHEHPEGGPSDSHARFNELHASADLGAWQLSAGKKTVSWDVGYAFRPNDVVQQEQRRSLLDTPLEGRPLLQAEYFEAERATSLVWVQPQHLNRDTADQRGVNESALALRHYERQGALDAYAFARLGQHTGTSVGAALAWVATESLELHASGRWMQRFDGWQRPASAAPLASANPWAIGTHGHAGQLLIGGQWTGEQRQSVLLEVWRDTTAPRAAQWRAWQADNVGLNQLGQRPGVPAAAVAGNLAWQTSPLGDGGTLGPMSLQRNNVFARVAWQPEGWQYSLDVLWHPADDGFIATAGLQWQGHLWRWDMAWRWYGGPSHAVLAQLPQKNTLALMLNRSF